MNKKTCFTAGLLVCVVVLGFVSLRTYEKRKPLIFSESLEEVVATVDDRPHRLKDLAFYVAYQEKSVQEQAIVYDPESPQRYWNVLVNGKFIRKEAKDAVLEMAIHDEVFYRMALSEGVKLDTEEEQYCKNEISDFCSDLDEEQFAALGVTEQEIGETMYRIALANKYQSSLAEREKLPYVDYNFDGEAYQMILASHTYTIEEDIAGRISVGSITLNH